MKNDVHEMVTISKEEYDDLVEASERLDALEGMGVDNWEGYDEAMELYHERKREELSESKSVT